MTAPCLAAQGGTLHHLAKTDPDPRFRCRTQAMLMLAQGESVLGVARWFRNSPTGCGSGAGGFWSAIAITWPMLDGPVNRPSSDRTIWRCWMTRCSRNRTPMAGRSAPGLFATCMRYSFRNGRTRSVSVRFTATCGG